ncbi:MAG: MATE family efflux transporter [Mariniphaga sp.]
MNRDILRLAVPNIVSNITVPLLGLADMALMGHLGSELNIGAIALGGVLFNFIYWGFGFLRMSTSGFAAQAYGENHRAEMITVLVRSLIIAAFTGLFIVALQSPIAWAGFGLIGGSEEVKTLAREYFLIRIWAAPAALSLLVFSGWFLGMQNARYPMAIAITANVANILISVLFVYGLNMKSNGVALGTALSQYLGLVLAVILFYKKYRKLTVFIDLKNVFQLKRLSNFFRVNTDIFIRSFCIILVFTFFTSESASTNDTILAVNSLLLQLLLFFSFFIDGFAYAGEALVGKFFGAKQHEQLRKVVKLLFVWGTTLALFFTLVYFSGINFILGLLTSQEEVLQNAQPYLIWVIFIPLASFSSFIWDGIFIGATASAAMRNTLLAATFLVFAPAYFIMSLWWGNHALWLAMVLFMLARGMVQTFLYKRSILMIL